MMTKETLHRIEPFIHRLMSDEGMVLAIDSIMQEEIRLVEKQFYAAAMEKDATRSNMLVGQIDGINNFWLAFRKVAEGYRIRKTSES